MTLRRLAAALTRLRDRWRAGEVMRRLSKSHDPVVALLLDDALGAALVIDGQGAILRTNAALRRMLPAGFDLAGSAEPLFHPASREAAWGELRRVLRPGAGGSRSFVSALCGDTPEDEQPVRVLAVPLRRLGGRVSGVLLRMADISEQRQLEAQLAHSQKLQATGQLAGGIAHDFNNLLTAILGAADSILERGADRDTEDDASQIRASALRGAALVRQLLAFGRQQTLQPRTLAVNEVITDISHLLRRLLGSQIRLALDLEVPGRMVRADPTQLDQVLVNLAVNARDAMRQGGVLTLRSGHITLFRPLAQGAETIPPGRYVMIEVQDTGQGIPPDILPRVFDPFFTTKREQGGSGLGLSTVHGIIRQSEGFLAVESTPGTGTSMRIYLPRWDGAEAVAIPRVPQPAACAPAPQAAPAPLEHGVVLLVDDEDLVRRLAERALARAGWTVLSAESGDDALDVLRRREPDSAPIRAMVTDMVMPGMDGASLTQAVRSACGNARLPVVLVSGYAEAPLRSELTTGNTLFLAKPYSLTDLVGTLDRAMAQPEAAALRRA
jgi:two-component system cell cycle sensor histidine kinase/response regulator CckA